MIFTGYVWDIRIGYVQDVLWILFLRALFFVSSLYNGTISEYDLSWSCMDLMDLRSVELAFPSLILLWTMVCMISVT